MRLLIILLTLLVSGNSFGQNLSKTVRMEGQNIAISNISDGYPLTIKDESKENYNTFRFFKSEDNSYFCSSPIEPLSKRENLVFKIYNGNGEELWNKTNEGFFVLHAFVKPESNLIHTIWESRNSEFCEKCSFYRAYDLKGNLVKEIENFGYSYINKAGNAFYSLGRNNETYTLGYFNYNDNRKWLKQFDSKLRIYAISQDGNYLLMSHQEEIILIDNNGTIVWKQPKTERYYQCSFSDNSKYFTQCNSYTDFKLIETNTGKELNSKQNFKEEYKDKRILGVSFVEGTSNHIAVSYIVEPRKVSTVIYSLDGSLIDKFNFDYKQHFKPEHLKVKFNNSILDLSIKGISKKIIKTSKNFLDHE